MTSIGVLGSGTVGKIIAAGFKKHGHPVLLGSRDPAKLEDWGKCEGAGVVLTSSQDVCEKSDVIILCVQGVAASVVLQSCAEHIKGKIIIDATNPIQEGAAPVGGMVPYFKPASGHASLMESLQAEFPESNFVKAFNSIGNQFMIDPVVKDGPPTMMICGNDAGAKATATALIQEVGHEVLDMGLVNVAPAIEALCQLWCARGFTGE